MAKMQHSQSIGLSLGAFLSGLFPHWEDGTFAIEQTWSRDGLLYVVQRFDMPGKTWRYSPHGIRQHMDLTRVGKASY